MTSHSYPERSDEERERLTALNRRIVEAFGIGAADLDEVIIRLRPGEPPEISIRRNAPMVDIRSIAGASQDLPAPPQWTSTEISLPDMVETHEQPGPFEPPPTLASHRFPAGTFRIENAEVSWPERGTAA